MKRNITIKVSGPGLTISDEVYYIAEILEKKNFEVEIIDEHPPLIDDYTPENIDGSEIKIKLIANHLPWGG